MTKYLSSLVLALCFGATAALAQDAPATDDGAKKYPAPSVARGKKVWTENCARCHEMRDPKDLTDREWPAVIRHMRIRGGLTGQEERDLFELFIKGNS
ncbi:MAG: cytochrome c [Pseudomonadota bacterium]